MAKTWCEKLKGGKPPHVEVTTKAFAGIPVGSKMLISSPMEFRDYINQVKGSQTVAELKEALAKRHGAETVCPLTTGIFLRIVAEAAYDEIEAGKSPSDVTPFWRVISPKDKVAGKLRCGPEFIAAQRLAEGI
ncbi:MAG: hypothetical protein ABL949_13715 [Fimbriimonadaceae bacterium]